MNIILYGIPADTAELIAGRYDLELIHSIEEIGTCGALLPVPKITAPRQLLALYNALMRHEDAIDAVIICGSETCGAAGTICYGAPPGKISHSAAIRKTKSWKRSYSGCSMPSSRKPTVSTSETAYFRKKTQGVRFSKFFRHEFAPTFSAFAKNPPERISHNRMSPRATGLAA